MKVLLVFGTRPEAIKMCPVYKALKQRPSLDVEVCVTAQHRDMLDQVLEVFQVTPAFDLNIMKPNQSLAHLNAEVLKRVTKVYRRVRPDVVLVHGDTSTTYAAAVAAFYCGILVGHVEAGLRTNDISSPFPEEFNRRAVSLISTYDFAPTQRAADNLIAEGKSSQNIVVTGNTVIDALSYTVSQSYNHECLRWAGDDRLILVTAHRRESWGSVMKGMFSAIRKVADTYPGVRIVYPVHKSPAVRDVAQEVLGNHERIRLIEPVDVVDFHNLMARSYCILTDSGGIQEEAPSMGVPVLVMRTTTERPEGIEAGTVKLVGTKEEDIYHACAAQLDDVEGVHTKMSHAENPYGDGLASERIADFIEQHGSA